MNTRNRLNCYVFSNLIISFLSLNLFATNHEILLVEKNSLNTLNKIYEKEIVEVVEIPEVLAIDSKEEADALVVKNPVVKSVKTESKTYQKPSYNSLTGTNLVNYATNFIGLPYVYAGRSLATGTDCSGFTHLIYREFGVNLGTTVASQIHSGTYVSKEDLQPGDLVFYSYGSVASHVAIYMGNGLIIHESTPRYGVKISSVNIMNYITARRVITADVVSPSTKTETTTSPKNEVATENTIVETPVVVDEVEEVHDQLSPTEPTSEPIVPEQPSVEIVEPPVQETEEIVEDANIEDNGENNIE